MGINKKGEYKNKEHKIIKRKHKIRDMNKI
jgi:hypothetical protein